jgi:hypothetical protein
MIYADIGDPAHVERLPDGTTQVRIGTEAPVMLSLPLDVARSLYRELGLALGLTDPDSGVAP